MNTEKSKKFLTNASFVLGEANLSENPELLNKIKDKAYFDFLNSIQNGGLFFDNSLQLYGINAAESYLDIEHVNATLKKEFGELFEGLYSFGQDIFGNQFAFIAKSSAIVLFECESADVKEIASNFENWIDEILGDLDYYTGQSLGNQWMESNDFFSDERLCPRRPFIIGGEYEIENLHSLDYPKYIEFYADLAKQIVNIKDGEKVKITLKQFD